jgi:hypothetical protein
MDVAGLDRMHWANLPQVCLRSCCCADVPSHSIGWVALPFGSKSTGEALQSLREAAIPDKGASRQQ